MTEGFDKAKASTDLKQLLKMSGGKKPHDEAALNVVEHTRGIKRMDGFEAVKTNNATKDSQQLSEPFNTSLNTHTNSNGNALLGPVGHECTSGSIQRDRSGHEDNQPMLKLPGKISPGINSTSIKQSSEVRSGKKSYEALSIQNSKDSLSDPKVVASPVNSRNTSAGRNKKKGGDSARPNTGGGKDPHVREGSQGSGNNMYGNNWKNQAVESESTDNTKATHIRFAGMELSTEYLMLLEENKIHLLKKKSQKFPKAKFFCHLCDYHLHVKDDCDKHIKDSRHCRRKEIHEVDAVLRTLPKPSQMQLAALTTAVEKIYETYGIDELQQKQRAEVVLRLEKTLRETMPDVVMNMYGSSLTGFGLKTSDINVDLTSSDPTKKLTSLLKDAYNSLKDRTDFGFRDVRSDFTAKVPSLLLTDELTGLTINVAIHCYSAHCSSQLLAIYSDFTNKVRKLAVAFRYWAHVCGLDRHSDGYIPPQALNLMVIYFLQTITPQVVPIIQPPKVTGDEVGDFSKDCAKFDKLRTKVMEVSTNMSKPNDMSLGELWLKLLKFYSLEFDIPNVVVSIRANQAVSRHCKPWNSKKFAVEDPYMLKKNITRMANSSHVYEYWQDSIRKALHYFGFPRDSEGKTNVPTQVLKKGLQDSKAVAQPTGARRKNKPEIANKSENNGDKEEGDTMVKETEAAPVVVAPNPLLLHRVPSSSKECAQLNDCVSYKPQAESVDGDSNTPGYERQDSGTDLCLATMQPSSGNTDAHSSQSCDIDSHDGAKSSVHCNITIPADSVSISTPASSSHQTSSSVPLGLVGLDSVTDFVELPQVMSMDPSQKAADNTQNIATKPIISVVGKTSDQRKAAHIDSSVHDSKNKLQNTSVFSSDTVPCDKEPPSKAEMPASVCESVDDSQLNSQPISDSVKSLHADQNSKCDSYLSPMEATIGKLEVTNREDTQGNLYYEFSQENLTGGKAPVLVCTYCEKEGHLKKACPEDELPEILPLSPLTPYHEKVLSETLSKLPAEVGLSEEDLSEREKFMKALEEFIRVQFNDANLALFGSSCNGFGFVKSDMDICLTFAQRKVPDKSKVVESLANKLKQHMDLTNVEAIPTAKVPIVKFTVKKTGLEGDISLYNILAQQNTKLLLCYSKIDPRVSILGYTIKTFAKVCDIGDASRGSLSSYAYILMMLYYLQQVEPPVIPVLQELYKGEVRPQLLIEGWDAWFMDDLSQLDELWPEKGKNKMSVAELWLGFLCFYVEEFKLKEYVISIRQKSLLTRFEKLWNGSCLAIEDPFDLSHNLGSGLTGKMNNFILKTFVNGRILYGSPVDENMEMFNKYQSPSDYFFDTDLLSECRPPNVRGCRRCGKIGHLSRHCPAALKDKEEEQKRVQQQLQQQQLQVQLQQQMQLVQQLYDKQGFPPHLMMQPKNLQKMQHHLPHQQHQRQAQPQRMPQQQQQQHRNQLPKQQQMQENERDSRDKREQERWQNDAAANINRNASAPSGPGLPFNFANHPNLQLATPAALRGLQPQLFDNPNFLQQQQQQQSHRFVMPSGAAHPPPNYMSQPAMLPLLPNSQNMNTFKHAPPNVHSNWYNPQGYQVPPKFSGWHPFGNNNNQRSAQTQHATSYSGYVNDSNNANLQGMNPRVQNLFASAKGQVLDAGLNQTHRRK